MKDAVPITRHPRWDGANITWVVPRGPAVPPSGDIERARPYPLEDLLRAIGRELDLEAETEVIIETLSTRERRTWQRGGSGVHE
jgi:hypothetical protein